MQSGIPTRIHQQIRKLLEKHQNSTIFHNVLRVLQNKSTKEAKQAELKFLKYYFNQMGIVPVGNAKSFKPEKSK